MTSARSIRKSVGTPVLLGAVAGIALTASGCIIGDSNSNPPCTPDLYVNVRIVDAVTNAMLTCDQVPATTVRVFISGVATDFPCPVGASQQQIPFYLDVTGTYTVQVQLLDGGTVLSDTGSGNSISVDCSGQTQTPLIDLAVN